MQSRERALEPQITSQGEISHPGGDSQIFDPFRASVRGKDANGKDFCAETILDSFGYEWLCLRLVREVKEGARLFAIVHLSDEKVGTMPPLRVAVRGIAVKVERRLSQAYSVAVRITRHRML